MLRSAPVTNIVFVFFDNLGFGELDDGVGALGDLF